MTGDHACGAHSALGAELRGTALLLLERVRTAVEPLQRGTAPEPGSAGACQACPVCAVLAVLRGERSDLAARLAEHATGLVAVLAAVLQAETGDAPRTGRPCPDPPAAGEPGAGASRVDAPGDRERRPGESPAGEPRNREPGGARETAAGTGGGGRERTDRAEEPVRPVDVPLRGAGHGARVPSAHGRSVQRITVHRR